MKLGASGANGNNYYYNGNRMRGSNGGSSVLNNYNGSSSGGFNKYPNSTVIDDETILLRSNCYEGINERARRVLIKGMNNGQVTSYNEMPAWSDGTYHFRRNGDRSVLKLLNKF